ncbi:transforming growth factor-beta-induced protein ig-h3-like [Mercenaria mercenaria]|uniref:transforming growth factor-beta-induced protein ig-h3-like n=1 Tax=Mercenaria mercenaria TaxID=6596 RepID=UPI00234F9E3D|nr:transforming growth factor-beta-induced protein ig-h3-like [Mercenaria mercenaria]
MAKILIFFACVAGALSATVVDVLKARREATLVSLIQLAGLETALSGEGPFTVFAPSETAFRRLGSSTLAALKSDPTKLAEILKYHVVSGIYDSSNLTVNEMMLDSLSQQKIRVNYYMYNKHIAVEGARVIGANYRASNGIVHIVDKVMMAPTGTIADILSTNSDLTTLKAAVDAAGLTSALTEGPYTLFAPTDAAFALLGNDTIQALLGETDLLQSILLYHVIHGTLYSTGMHSGALHTLEDVDRERLTASFGGYQVSVDGARVTQKDISATNGVIHVINHVLLPSSLKSAIANLKP